MRFKFDLQRFKGTNFDVYMPGEYESELQHVLGTNGINMLHFGDKMLNLSKDDIKAIKHASASSRRFSVERYGRHAEFGLGHRHDNRR